MSLVPYTPPTADDNTAVTIREWAVSEFGQQMSNLVTNWVFENGPRYARALARRIRNGVMQEPDPELIQLVNNANYRYESQPIHERVRRELFPQLPSSEQVEPSTKKPRIMNEESKEAARAEGTSTNSKLETPVIPYQPSYGLPNTYTTILPVNIYFSVGGLQHAKPANFRIRLNGLYDTHTTLTAPAGGSNAFGANPILWNVPVPTAGNTTFNTPPTAFPATSTTSVVPAWRDYFETLYEAYHVMGVEWVLTAVNVHDRRGADLAIFNDYESYGQTSGGTIPDTISLNELMAVKSQNFKILESAFANDTEWKQVITGRWYPGKKQHNVRDDNDVNTWTTTSSNPTTWTDKLRFMFYKAPLTASDNDGSNATGPRCNCWLQVKYKVQFKDLRPEIRAPSAAWTSSMVQTLPVDALQGYT